MSPRQRLARERLELIRVIRPPRRPLAQRTGSTVPARFNQILCLLPVLIEVWTCREGNDVVRIRVHTNLLSSHAWSPHESG
jgi:hypothetical protein